MRTFLAFILLTSVAWADDLVVCDPTSQPVANAVTRFDRTIDGEPLKVRSGFLVWQAPHNLMTPEQQAQMNTRRSQFDALAQVPTRYWKCLDSNADGLLDAVGEMTQAEQDTVDAPRLVAEAQARTDQSTLATLDAQLADDVAWGKLLDAEKVDALRRREVLKEQLGR